jgi:pilus assembly protein CpaB
MDRRTRTLIVVAIALGAAGIATFVVYQAIAHMPVREVEVAHNYVVVANRPMELGTLLTKDDVKLVAWPARDPVPGSFSRIDAVVDRGLIAPVNQNEPITESRLASFGVGGGLPPSIPAGMRAISVKVNEVIGVAGFAVPGTRVDVVVTVREKEDSMSRVVVNNVQVLTAGTRYDHEQAKDGKPIPSTVVTLLVTPQDSERIALASNEGAITLALRNPLDQVPIATTGVRTASLMGQPDGSPVPKTVKGRKVMVASKPAPAVVAPPPPPYTVEAIRAAKRTEEPIR